MSLHLCSDDKLARGFDKWTGDLSCEEGAKSHQETTAAAEASIAGAKNYDQGMMEWKINKSVWKEMMENVN